MTESAQSEEVVGRKEKGRRERTPSERTTTLPELIIFPDDGCASTPSRTAVLSSTSRCERS
jgi:hypothetical protein